MSSVPVSPGRYLAALALGCLGILAAVAAFLTVAYQQNQLAAPPLTGNKSFDEKVLFLRQRGGMDCEVLAIGSSMTLSDLNSETIERNLPAGWRFLNAASWGMKIKHMRAQLEFMLKTCRPRAVIIVSSSMDFFQDPRRAAFFDEDEVRNLIGGGSYLLALARHFDLSYYISNFGPTRRLRTERSDFASFAFDRGGGVPLEPPRVDAFRWDKKVEPENIDSTEYSEVERIAELLKTRGIAFVFVQPPFRAAALTAEALPPLQRHWQRLDEILRARGFRFGNLHEKLKLPDDCFADYSHLNAKGSRVFTQALAEEYKEVLSAEY